MFRVIGVNKIVFNINDNDDYAQSPCVPCALIVYQFNKMDY